MNCYCYINDNDDFDAICPGCFKIGRGGGGENVLEYRDYVTKPTILCDCAWIKEHEPGFRAVLKISIDKLKYLEKNMPKPVSLPQEYVDKLKYDEFFKELVSENTLFYKFPFAFITRVVASNLSGYSSKVPLTREQITEFVNSECSDEVAKKYNIETLDEDKYDVSDLDPDRPNMMRNLFNLSLECNSYNIAKPIVPYPKNFSLDHDGVFVFYEYFEKGR